MIVLLINVLMTNIVIGISLPQELLAKVDGERGDVSRSRFLQRLVEQAYAHASERKEGGSQA